MAITAPLWRKSSYIIDTHYPIYLRSEAIQDSKFNRRWNLRISLSSNKCRDWGKGRNKVYETKISFVGWSNGSKRSEVIEKTSSSQCGKVKRSHKRKQPSVFHIWIRTRGSFGIDARKTKWTFSWVLDTQCYTAGFAGTVNFILHLMLTCILFCPKFIGNTMNTIITSA